MGFYMSFTLDEHQGLVLKEAQREGLSVSLSLCSGKTPFEIMAEGLNSEDVASSDEKHFAFISSLFRMIFQFYLGFN